MAKYDDLFKNDAERLADTQERIQSLPLDKLVPFPNHPFKVLDDEKMQETVDSIRDYGVLVPILVRPKDDGNFEIVAGHRRHHASMLAGKTEIPAVVRDMDDDAAILVMVDSNLQRETILPSEKAFAYKMKLDAMKRQGKRTDLTSAQLVPKLQARDVVARDAGINRMEVTRF
ncbi:MAG: ParB/RepB/Spo0J family partition protein, partial [Clostridia bacterium]